MPSDRNSLIANLITTIISGIFIALAIAGLRAIKKNNEDIVRIQSQVNYLQLEVDRIK